MKRDDRKSLSKAMLAHAASSIVLLTVDAEAQVSVTVNSQFDLNIGASCDADRDVFGMENVEQRWDQMSEILAVD